MNNSKLLYVAATLLILLSCTRQQMPAPDANGASSANSSHHYGQFNPNIMARIGAGYCRPIPVDSANRMIMSYLNGINYGVNTNATRALIYNADSLREYLNDTTRGKIAFVKFMFAHNMNYINSGKEGKRPDSNDNAITLVIVGYDQNNNYVLNKNNMVLDNCFPCPDLCESSGSASYNIIQ